MRIFKRKTNTLKNHPGNVQRSDGHSKIFLEFMYGKEHVKKLKKYGEFK